MSRIVIIGNSGSGKTSLAKRLSTQSGSEHLDLDDIAWKRANPPERASLEDSRVAIDAFVAPRRKWIIEGCYSSLIAYAANYADQMFLLNIGVDACIENCRSREWEPGKYPSKEAQDENLGMLIKWVETYETREDEFSLHEHRKVYDSFLGLKTEVFSNEETQRISMV